MLDISVSTIRHLLSCHNCLCMYDALFISLFFLLLYPCMSNQTTKQQTMIVTRTTKGNFDCSDFDYATPLLLFSFLPYYWLKHILLRSLAKGILRSVWSLETINEWLLKRYRLLQIPPGWSKSYIQNVSCTNCRVASIRIHNSTRHFHVMAFSHGRSFLLC